MEIISMIFGAISIFLGIKTYQLNNEKFEREKTLEKFKEFAEGMIMFDYTYIDVVIIGPRDSGKTSIVQLWTDPWTEIGDIESSAVWQTYEKDIHEFKEETRKNPLISMEQIYQPTLRLRAHDYPGEPSFRNQAISKINELSEKVVLVFVFQVAFVNGKIECYVDNASYFSAKFMDTVSNHVGKVAKAIVVFNKADILPQDWSDSKAIDELMNANHDAIYQIDRTFSSELEYHLTSAVSNKGLIRLLGNIGLAGIESKKELKSFNKKIEHLTRKFGIVKG